MIAYGALGWSYPVGRGGAAEAQGRYHFAMACNTEGQSIPQTQRKNGNTAKF
jgi:hypothetical protein